MAGKLGLSACERVREKEKEKERARERARERERGRGRGREKERECQLHGSPRRSSYRVAREEKSVFLSDERR